MRDNTDIGNDAAVGHTQGRSEWVPTRDGRRLHAMVLPGPELGLGSGAGKGRPTVVFEAGSAANRSSWASVQPAVGAFARAIVYDRSGLGRSAPDPNGRTLWRMSEDLADVLDHYGPGPFVLVGHSAGGPIVRLAASLRPGLVAGLVLVDPTDEAADLLFGRGFRRGEWIATRVMLVLARMGLLKRMFGWLVRAAPADDVRRDVDREAFTPGVVRTQIEQTRTFLDELAAWRTDPPTLGPFPVTVVSGARAGDGMGKKIRAAANASHAHRASQSPDGRHVLAKNSSHYVPLTDPELISDEIRRLC